MSNAANTVQFSGVSSENVEAIKSINAALFPISYAEKIYRDMVACGDVTQVATLNGRTVGAIGCRLQMKENGKAKLYILTLGVLAPYRNQGIGSELLRRSLLVCGCDEVIEEAELHVHVSNTDAIRFYERYGFQQVEICPNYYPTLSPSDAVLLRKGIQSVVDDNTA